MTHEHTDACWEPDSGCDMGRSEAHVRVSQTSEEQIAALRARVKECEKVMAHYCMETEHSCMCQFLNDTDTLSSECHYHEQIRLRAEQAERDAERRLELLREVREDAAYFGMPTTRIDAELEKKP